MPIERIRWTSHAEVRCRERLLDRAEVERVVRAGHAERRINRGEADWLVDGRMADGRRLEVVYDQPYGTDRAAALIVSVWDI